MSNLQAQKTHKINSSSSIRPSNLHLFIQYRGVGRVGQYVRQLKDVMGGPVYLNYNEDENQIHPDK